MKRRNDLSAREQLQDAVLHAPADAPFDSLRQQLGGSLVGNRRHVLTSLRFPDWMQVSDCAIARDGTFALVGRRKDGKAELKLWHLHRGLSPAPLAVADIIEQLQWVPGSPDPVFVLRNFGPEGSRADDFNVVWGEIEYDDGLHVERVMCAVSEDGRYKYLAIQSEAEASRSVVHWSWHEAEGGSDSDVIDPVWYRRTFDEYHTRIIGIAQGEPIMVECDTRSNTRVNWPELGYKSDWFDMLLDHTVSSNAPGGGMCFVAKTGSNFTFFQGRKARPLESVRHHQIFASEERVFAAVRGELVELTGSLRFPLRTGLEVRKVVCLEKTIHVVTSTLDEIVWVYEVFDVETGKCRRFVLNDRGEGPVIVHKLGTRLAVDFSKNGFRFWQEEKNCMTASLPKFPPWQLAETDLGIMGWAFSDQTLHVIRYELSDG